MRRGDVYWVDFEPAIGGEVRKRRPAVLVSNDDANRILNRLQVVPLTTNVRRVYASEALVQFRGTPNKAMAHQLTTVAKERVRDHAGRVSLRELRDIERAIRAQLSL